MHRQRWGVFALSLSALVVGHATTAIAAPDSDDNDDDSRAGVIAPAPALPQPQTGPMIGPIQPSDGSPLPAPTPLPPPVAAPAPPPPPVAEDKAAVFSAGADRLSDSTSQRTQAIAALRAQRSKEAADYYGVTGDISGKLATGVPEADPILEGELARARQSLETLQGNTDQLATIASQLTDDAASALYLAKESSDEMGVPGKTTAARAAVGTVEGKVSALQATIDQTLRGILNEVDRERRSLKIERQNLALLGREIQLGALETTSGPIDGSPDADTGADGSGASIRHPAAARVGPAPLSVIARDAAAQSYEHQLYDAVRAVLQTSPNASFTVQATTQGDSTAAGWAIEAADVQRKAEDVVRSLSTFGLPRSRIHMTQGSDASLDEPAVEVFSHR